FKQHLEVCKHAHDGVSLKQISAVLTRTAQSLQHLIEGESQIKLAGGTLDSQWRGDRECRGRWELRRVFGQAQGAVPTCRFGSHRRILQDEQNLEEWGVSQISLWL